MRAMGVPARVVTGYQGADPQLVDGYLIVRNSYAHAWAEYWQPGVGWVRADPTAAVAPDRIGASRNLAPAPGLVAGALGAMSPNLLAQLRDGWEALNNRWNQWVLNYSRGQQFDLLKRLGVASPSWEDLALAADRRLERARRARRRRGPGGTAAPGSVGALADRACSARCRRSGIDAGAHRAAAHAGRSAGARAARRGAAQALRRACSMTLERRATDAPARCRDPDRALMARTGFAASCARWRRSAPRD